MRFESSVKSYVVKTMVVINILIAAFESSVKSYVVKTHRGLYPYGRRFESSVKSYVVKTLICSGVRSASLRVV